MKKIFFEKYSKAVHRNKIKYEKCQTTAYAFSNGVYDENMKNFCHSLIKREKHESYIIID